MVIAQQNIANTLLHYFFSKKAVFKQFFKQHFSNGLCNSFCNSFGIFQEHFFRNFSIAHVQMRFGFMNRYLLNLVVIFGLALKFLKDSTTYFQIWARFCHYFYCKQFDYCNTFLVKVLHNYYCNTFLSEYFYCYCNTFIWSITML